MRRLVVVLAVVLAACGVDDVGKGESNVPTPTTVTVAPGVLPTCDELFGDGVTLLGADAFDIACTSAEDPEGVYYAAQSLDCADGRKLVWAEVGWGFTGEAWHANASEPPQAVVDAC